ncbi:ornithine cyclodeaminase family protein [Actinomyces wuliandei]|uniref:ornithine cyclodeaminase family protein n=1 Tax=Actinomyces wuliandei TaxID=2057743 RepID=UPI0015D5F3D1|nr:ornithine cyclodeaminase family protein [Actinomyces wuliandei]
MIQLNAESLWTAADNQEFWIRLADRMAVALREQAADLAASSPRHIIRTSIGNGLGIMAAVAERPNTAIMGAKIVSLTYHTSQERPSHPGTVILLDPASGELQAALDANAITAMRTAATTCAVTRHMRPEAARFTIIGTGTEVRSHLLALSAAYPNARFTIWGRRREAASKIATKYRLEGISVSTEPNLTKALRDADVVTSLTAAKSPFLDIRHVGESAHVNAIGASTPGLAEWTPRSFGSVDVLACDTVEECRRQSTEIPAAFLDSAVNASTVLEYPPWKSTSQGSKRSLYKSVGSAVLDIVASTFLVELVYFSRNM